MEIIFIKDKSKIFQKSTQLTFLKEKIYTQIILAFTPRKKHRHYVLKYLIVPELR